MTDVTKVTPGTITTDITKVIPGQNTMDITKVRWTNITSYEQSNNKAKTNTNYFFRRETDRQTDRQTDRED